MKKLYAILSGIVLCILLCITVAACKETEPSPYVPHVNVSGKTFVFDRCECLDASVTASYTEQLSGSSIAFTDYAEAQNGKDGHGTFKTASGDGDADIVYKKVTWAAGGTGLQITFDDSAIIYTFNGITLPSSFKYEQDGSLSASIDVDGTLIRLIYKYSSAA